jgi:hypothetical protein
VARAAYGGLPVGSLPTSTAAPLGVADGVGPVHSSKPLWAGPFYLAHLARAALLAMGEDFLGSLELCKAVPKTRRGARGVISQSVYGGDAGIRTLDRALQPYNGLANRRLQPLGHVSSASCAATYARRIRSLQARQPNCKAGSPGPGGHGSRRLPEADIQHAPTPMSAPAVDGVTNTTRAAYEDGLPFASGAGPKSARTQSPRPRTTFLPHAPGFAAIAHERPINKTCAPRAHPATPPHGLERKRPRCKTRSTNRLIRRGRSADGRA